MKNPYANATVTLKNGDPVTEYRVPGSRERMHSESSGELNAYHDKDLLKVIGDALRAASSGNIIQRPRMSATASAERAELVALSKDNPERWAALGQDIVTQISETREREGFMRSLLLPSSLKNGEIARVRCKKLSAQSVVVTGPASIGYQYIKDNNYAMPEFEIVGNIAVKNIDIQQNGTDSLDDAYNQGLQAFMVQEDRLLMNSLRKTIGLDNPVHYISGELTPGIFSKLRTGVSDWGLSASTALLHNSYWDDFVTNPDWSNFLEPVSKYELLYTGYLGQILGCNLRTDGFKDVSQQVVSRGEIVLLSSPEYVGAYVDRGGIQAKPTDGSNRGSTDQGWFMYETLGMLVANGRAVQVGKKI